MTKQNSILHKRRSSKSNPGNFGVSVRKAGRVTLVSDITRVRPIDTIAGDEAADEPEPTNINGQPVGSRYEWRLALALWDAGMDFEYQVSVMGGRAMRGGQVIDFVVNTLPLPTPVFADGEYWHTGQMAREDITKRIVLEDFFGDTMNPPLTAFGPDLHTVASAREWVRKVFRR